MPDRFRILLAWVLSSLAILTSHQAFAQTGKDTLWRDAVTTELDVDFGAPGFHARWRYHRCRCGDLLVQVEQSSPDGVLTGELLMVGGEVLLARGFEQQDTSITSLMQAPSLMLQLVYSLLNRAEPSGPDVVDKRVQWNVKEAKKNFVLNSGFATGFFAAPWEVSGAAWRTGTDTRRFELKFVFNNQQPGQQKNTSAMLFSGDLDYRDQEFPFPETTSLDGWKVQWFAKDEEESVLVSDGMTLKMLRQQAKTP